MLDPEWTPERGYAHALDLLKKCEQREAELKCQENETETGNSFTEDTTK